MGRDYKELTKGQYYHIYNRGHNRQLIFTDDQDYLQFMKRLKMLLGHEPIPNPTKKKGYLSFDPLPPDSFDIIAYCLMPNHFHFLIRQNSEVPISLLISRLFTGYAKYFNKRHQRIGTLFQDTFKAKIVDDDSYLVYLSAYIHNNPENLYSNYSSFLEYINPNFQPAICRTALILNVFNNDLEMYKKFVISTKSAKSLADPSVAEGNH